MSLSFNDKLYIVKTSYIYAKSLYILKKEDLKIKKFYNKPNIKSKKGKI